MAILKVLTFPNKILLTKSADVGKVTDGERRLIRNMIETMHAQEGVGLAANQIGILKQIFVACPDRVKGQELVFLNPRIIKKRGSVKEFEGCLSVPEIYEPVRRAKKVCLKAMTPDGKTVEVKAEGLLARIFQHETDHLQGILFVYRLGILKSRLAKKRLVKRIRCATALR
jgi:peptide deformylase